MSVRRAHNTGKNHLRNVVDYYQRESPHYARRNHNHLTRRYKEIGHDKAQSVIDSITSSYAAEGQAQNNPMLPHNQPHGFGAPGMFPPPFPGGKFLSVELEDVLLMRCRSSSSFWYAWNASWWSS